MEGYYKPAPVQVLDVSIISTSYGSLSLPTIFVFTFLDKPSYCAQLFPSITPLFTQREASSLDKQIGPYVAALSAIFFLAMAFIYQKGDFLSIKKGQVQVDRGD